MRRERRKLELHKRILEAAVELFDAQGVSRTTVAQISERADVAHKTFFNHFATKQDLLREIALQSTETFLADILEMCEKPASTAARLARVFGMIVDNIEAAGPMHRELLTELIYAHHEAGTEGEQQRAIHDTFELVVEKGRTGGDVSSAHSVESQANLVLGNFYVLMFNWAHVDGYPLRERAGEAAALLADALCTRQE